VLNQILLTLAEWIDAHSWSTALHESFYMYNWVESTHVLSLTIFLGMLFIIDFRMLGLTLTAVPASTIAARLNLPMMIGFAVMLITGLLLFYAVPVRTTQSIWFRIKFVLLIAAGVNAWLFHRKMNEAVATWDKDPVAPKRLRYGAALSLILWAGVVITGRMIAYDWYDCYRANSDLLAWAAGCMPE
jgi:uncharacterized membrane protein